jgi:predicted ABC-type ATPase
MKVLALVALLLLAGCGGAHKTTPRQPHLPHALAGAWRAQADGIAAALAAGDGCLAQQRAVALRISVIDAVNGRRLSPRFQETLLGAVNDLASRISCVPPPPQPAGHGDHGDHGDHGKHDRHGKHGEGGD